MQVTLQADQRPKQNHKNDNLQALPQEPYPLWKRTWTDVEPGEYSLNLLRQGSLQRENDGAIEFWRIKDYLQYHFVLSSLVRRKVEEKHGRRRRKQQKISVLF